MSERFIPILSQDMNGLYFIMQSDLKNDCHYKNFETYHCREVNCYNYVYIDKDIFSGDHGKEKLLNSLKSFSNLKYCGRHWYPHNLDKNPYSYF